MPVRRAYFRCIPPCKMSLHLVLVWKKEEKKDAFLSLQVIRKSGATRIKPCRHYFIRQYSLFLKRDRISVHSLYFPINVRAYRRQRVSRRPKSLTADDLFFFAIRFSVQLCRIELWHIYIFVFLNEKYNIKHSGTSRFRGKNLGIVRRYCPPDIVFRISNEWVELVYIFYTSAVGDGMLQNLFCRIMRRARMFYRSYLCAI